MKDIIVKLLMGTISENELAQLRNWLDDPKKQSLLESYVRDYYDLNLATLKNNVEEAYHKVVSRIDKNEVPVKKLFPNWIRNVAAVLLLFGIGYILQQNSHPSQDGKQLIPKDESITLELDNGIVKIIDVSKIETIRDSEGKIVGSQKKDRISYLKKARTKKLVSNTLTVPNGKRLELELSDGTVAHMNSGSSLRYPVNFLTDGPRQVFLSGEAYFDVAEDVSRPFIVNVNELHIKVLGTEFNISAYEEDANVDVVLVEGSVNLDSGCGRQDGPIILSPGQKGSFDHVSKGIEVEPVNTAIYTSWMQGHLVFRELTFDNILTKLERHYNITIENTNTELGQEVFNASFNKVEIEKVLSFFNDTHEIEYTIENNKVIIQ